MHNFTPFLQIVHISDLHVTDPRTGNAVATRNLIRKLRRFKILPKRLVDYIEEGLLPHDPFAVSHFSDFLNRISTNDGQWFKCKTWLIDTGDLTTLGDAGSLDLGRSYLDNFAKICPDTTSIYGNHDAWPGEFPLLANFSDFCKQPSALTSRRFVIDEPTLALRVPIPHGGGEVQLYCVDSIRHERITNTAALGEVPKSRIDRLINLVDQNYSSGRRDFRILAVHHPVHYPLRRHRFFMSMRNDRDLAKALDTPSNKKAHPLAHLILSGHTHSLFPDHGDLPLQPYLCVHPDLGNDQCQFVVGSLMQIADRYDKRKQWPQQCEVLRLYYSANDPSVLMVERLLAARQGGGRGKGIGPYDFVMPKGKNKVEEEITFFIN